MTLMRAQLRARRVVLPLAIWALLLGAGTERVDAHTFAPALLDIHETGGGTFDVRWTLPVEGEGLGTGTLRPQFPEPCRWLTAPSPQAEALRQGRLVCGSAGLDGATISVSGLDASHLDVVVRFTRSDGETMTAALRRGAAKLTLPARAAAAPCATRTVIASYLGLGVAHILTGYDHLLFVLGLVLLVESWRMLLKTISAFTLAHSITLALATLGMVHVPPAPVEAIIALSILLLAVELARAPDEPRTLTRRFPWLVAFVFGLLHGLGFAGALAQTGLPTAQITLALVAFNVGVELGQLLFVSIVIMPVRALKRLRRPAMRWVPAYGMGTLAAAWMIERVGRFWVS